MAAVVSGSVPGPCSMRQLRPSASSRPYPVMFTKESETCRIFWSASAMSEISDVAAIAWMSRSSGTLPSPKCGPFTPCMFRPPAAQCHGDPGRGPWPGGLLARIVAA